MWPEQIDGTLDLPIKGEDVLAVFDYVDGDLMCTRIDPTYRREYIKNNNEYLESIKPLVKLFL